MGYSFEIILKPCASSNIPIRFLFSRNFRDRPNEMSRSSRAIPSSLCPLSSYLLLCGQIWLLLITIRVLVCFFTPFVPEAPHHILLSVVKRCTKGVVRLTYVWCHVNIPLLCCNELYSWWTVTPRVSLCPLLLSAHWAWPRASALQVEFD